jgi:glycosyltransferase involved in cell wall biosynthesis
MTTHPLVSVVMSAYNGADFLGDSVRSILAQEGVDFELIVVNDGSSDGSTLLLDRFAEADSRVRVIHQDNRGVTRALARGCALARGTYIARQDCGDLSLPGRLLNELRAMESGPGTALVSCATRFVGPQGELLYDVAVGEADAMAGLLTLELQNLRGPAHHGSTLFRRDLYERVGGYREQFYFAQDLDLWIRLAELGGHTALPDLLYLATFSPRSISSLQRRRQIASARIILECARLRRAGLSESQAIGRAASIVPDGRGAGASDIASALYFVGVCLRKRGDPRARQYFRDALRAYPLHFKSAVRLLAG